MSGRLYFIPGESVFYTRKGEATKVVIIERLGIPESFGDMQYKFRRPDGTIDKAHESWFAFTEAEAFARRNRWADQQHGE